MRIPPSTLCNIAVTTGTLPLCPTFHRILITPSTRPPPMSLFPILSPLPIPLFLCPSHKSHYSSPSTIIPITPCHEASHPHPHPPLNPSHSATFSSHRSVHWPHLSLPNPFSTPQLPCPFPARTPYTPTYRAPCPHVQSHKPSIYAHLSPFSTPSNYNPSPLSWPSPISIRPWLVQHYLAKSPLHVYTFLQDKHPTSLTSSLLEISRNEFLSSGRFLSLPGYQSHSLPLLPIPTLWVLVVVIVVLNIPRSLGGSLIFEELMLDLLWVYFLFMYIINF